MNRYKRCHVCGATNFGKSKFCRRCDEKLELDRKKSLTLSFIFWFCGAIFYIPANIYPVLATSKFSNTIGSTIFGGMVKLWQDGEYPVAIIIFLASIMIPILKFIILIYLIISIKYRLYKNADDKVRLYYLIEYSGPWSLIDVFVVVILAGLIHFKNVSIIPGIGATSFAVMVFFTVLSAMSLDVRLLGEKK
jgi:paraquat-inducible protein A